MGEGWRALLTIAVITAHPGGADPARPDVDPPGATRADRPDSDAHDPARGGRVGGDDDHWLHVELGR